MLHADNYQGEESAIVVATLTRSNSSCDIGWMAAPERLNVLLSRARDALIMIGDPETFLNARKGKDGWIRFFDLLRHNGHVYDGFPVKCERHPDRRSVLSKPTDFDEKCPDGGCDEPCGTMLRCGLHPCPQKCHKLFDHSKIPCAHIIQTKCPKGHGQSRKCHIPPPTSCKKCDLETKERDKKLLRDFELQQKREEDKREHEKRIALLDENIDLERQNLRDNQLKKEREHILRQREKDLEDVKALAQRVLSTPSFANRDSPKTSKPAESKPVEPKPTGSPSTVPNVKEHTGVTSTSSSKISPPKLSSPSKIEWQRQKDSENARNDAIETLMDMIGLETVKSQVLRIKAKVDTTVRQNTDLKGERFGVVLLGNPGTGK